MTEYQCMLDFQTYGLPEIEDKWLTLSFVPQIGSNIYLASDEVDFKGKYENGAYLRVMDVDFMHKDNVFVVGLMEIDSFHETAEGA